MSRPLHPALRLLRAGVFLIPLLVVDWEIYAAWMRGEFSIKPALIFWWLLLPFQIAIVSGAFPDALSTGEYPPPPPTSLSRWTVHAPGVPYGCVFPAALLAIAMIESAISVAVDRGPQWTPEGVMVVVACGTALAAALGGLLWSRPRLDVDEEKRELVWWPGTVLKGRSRLPFDQVLSVEVVQDRAGWHPEIVWRSDKARVTRTRLPAGATRSTVDEVATRLRIAVGLPADLRRLLL